MCNQRERLIGFLYGEDNAHERHEMQRHLETCADCRAEIGALKSVREDLLAWDVPAHPPVWRPFAPAPVVPWYRQVPAWGLAAAASLMLLSGFAGGAVAHGVQGDRPVSAPALASPGVVQVSAPAPAAGAATPGELVAFAQRLAAIEQRVGTRVVNDTPDTHATLLTELRLLRDENQQLVHVIGGLYADLERKSKTADFKTGNLQTKIENLQAVTMALQAR